MRTGALVAQATVVPSEVHHLLAVKVPTWGSVSEYEVKYVLASVQETAVPVPLQKLPEVTVTT